MRLCYANFQYHFSKRWKRRKRFLVAHRIKCLFQTKKKNCNSHFSSLNSVVDLEEYCWRTLSCLNAKIKPGDSNLNNETPQTSAGNDRTCWSNTKFIRKTTIAKRKINEFVEIFIIHRISFIGKSKLPKLHPTLCKQSSLSI